jgi:hypothetical protein
VSQLWSNICLWFKNSETIFLARLEAFIGFLTAAIAYMDWSPFFGITDFNKTQVSWIGGAMLVKGVVSEVARRKNDPYLQKVGTT